MKAGDETLAKPRYIQVVDPKELAALIEGSGKLGMPLLVVINKAMYADADELRAWRSHNQSEGGK